ncbi:hypothetical protein ACFSOZ_38645 [Mesorhizobium newzealandense]|uniref:DUF4209 domain-containing protein n=3 Tax=Mesorhizobium TaxID=68287 RepID=A0ABW4W9D4_9HYPH|nr:hypothetical protein [Mesorhizobium sophorae]
MLSRLLGEFREPLLQIMPAALIDEIDLLFNFRGGPPIRHELAHGKMTDGEFWSPDATYSIWLVLHIVILPTLRFWDDVAAEITHRGRRWFCISLVPALVFALEFAHDGKLLIFLSQEIGLNPALPCQGAQRS